MKYLLLIALGIAVVIFIGLAFWAVIPKVDKVGGDVVIDKIEKKITIRDVVLEDTYPASEFQELLTDKEKGIKDYKVKIYKDGSLKETKTNTIK